MQIFNKVLQKGDLYAKRLNKNLKHELLATFNQFLHEPPENYSNVAHFLLLPSLNLHKLNYIHSTKKCLIRQAKLSRV